jgi:DNA polymerase III delta prime subunit
MRTGYDHLHPSVRPLADEDAASRIRRIRTDRWIAYARADLALSTIEDLLTFPKRTRMPNLLLVGPTNNGKTMIVEKFRRMHMGKEAAQAVDGRAEIPVVKVQMPSGPDEARVFGAILDELGMTSRTLGRAAVRQDAAVKLMRATKVRLLIFDELHNILSGTNLQLRRLLNLLRWLGNELQIPLVGVGTAEALRAVQADDQLANRFEPMALPLWRDGEEYRRLLDTLEAVLPLRRPSHLSEPAVAGKILVMAEGVLGEMIAIVTRAAVLAVTMGGEAITPNLIDQVGFVPPSARRRVSV